MSNGAINILLKPQNRYKTAAKVKNQLELDKATMTVLRTLVNNKLAYDAAVDCAAPAIRNVLVGAHGRSAACVRAQ